MPFSAVQFDSGFYERVVSECGYSDLSVEPFGAGFAGQSADLLAIRYLWQSNLSTYARTDRAARIVTIGFGMSGPPHMGTVCQLLGIRRLQEAGETCQVVFGDLDACTGKRRDLQAVRALAAQYRLFANRLGIEPDLLLLGRNMMPFRSFATCICLRSTSRMTNLKRPKKSITASKLRWVSWTRR
ncbi:hypothetical protein [Streptomyces sp. NBC_01803]|uniref:hypothetical protein n=1 Tax=Streptomyces sp. NBC_01803 TaxID=2975946 RepID=UPI003FA3A5BB